MSKIIHDLIEKQKCRQTRKKIKEQLAITEILQKILSDVDIMESLKKGKKNKKRGDIKGEKHERSLIK